MINILAMLVKIREEKEIGTWGFEPQTPTVSKHEGES